MRVLITNDDGIDAPGIAALARAVAARGIDVTVAAPVKEASGSSAAMTAVEKDGRIVIADRSLKGAERVRAYAVAGSPGFIALIGTRGAFGEPPDILLSGINRGANAGHAILHSGTVGAALTAAANGCRAMAVSLDVLTPSNADAATGGAAVTPVGAESDSRRNWDTAAEIAADLLPVLGDMPADAVLNVNVPDLPKDRIRGIRRAGMARFGQVQMAIAEVGKGFVRTALEEGPQDPEPGTDIAWLCRGYACATPLRAISEAADIPLPDLDHVQAGATAGV